MFSVASSLGVAVRSLMPQAIEEALRWEPPLTAIARTTMREVDI